MKRIILSVMVMAFAVAVQADDAKCKVKDGEKPACCPSKTKVSKDEGASCPFAKGASCGKSEQAKKNTTKQPVLLTPKAADAAK